MRSQAVTVHQVLSLKLQKRKTHTNLKQSKKNEKHAAFSKIFKEGEEVILFFSSTKSV
jgi:hypothetical protein